MASKTKRAFPLVLWAVAIIARAQTEPPSPSASTSEPTANLAPATSAAHPSTPRRVAPSPSSDQVSSAITAGISYHPPKPKEPETTPPIDLRDVDRPKNGIIRLPKYVVEGERPPIFSERNLYTSKGLADLAASRHLSELDRFFLNRYDILGSNAERALQEYADEERLKNMSETSDKISMLRQTGNTAEADQLQKDSYNTYLRQQPIGSTGNDFGAPSYLRRTP